MNPYILLALAVAWAASIAGTGWTAFGMGRDAEIAGQSKIKQAIEDTREKAQQGAADAIAKNRPINQTIVQKQETIVRENTVYRDCRHATDSVRNINRALTGAEADPAGGGELPKADTAKR